MLKRLRVDNFKCLVDFELELEGHALLMGLNGSGKSTVVEVLDRLRRFFVGGEKAGDCFPASTRTRWGDELRQQKFELDFDSTEGEVHIRLVLNSPATDEKGRVLVAQESARWPGVRLERDLQGGAHVYTEQQRFNGLVADDRSALSLLDSTALRLWAESWNVLREVSSLLSYRLDPATMTSVAQKPEDLQFDGRNFASWLLLIESHSEHRSVKERIESRVAELMRGFERFLFVKEGDSFRLFTEWKGSVHSVLHDFGALSDGQRLIVALSTIVEVVLLRETDTRFATILVLDEPDNYIALQEIQPLLFTLMDAPRTQVIVVSHHPEIIDLMAKDYGYVFAREADVGPVTVKRWRAPAGIMLSPSELVARGDIDGGA